MPENKLTKVPKKAVATKKASWFLTVCDLAGKGVSNSSIAARLGLTPMEFVNLMEYEQNGIKPVAQAMQIARANFEIDRVEMKDRILNDPNTSDSLKLKIVREDLKTLEAWAPATRAIKVTMEKAASEFSFEAFSETDLTAIAAAASGSDNNQVKDGDSTED